MCGIAGILSLDGSPLAPAATEAALARMSAALRHRGPDDEGRFVNSDRRCGLVHRRLAIIDPTPEAHQPMVASNGDALIFNGEIYNFRELRARYGLRVPESDTAVLLALLQAKGESALPELRGFFTFAYWNEGAQTLLIARDALGKKPLYYAERGQRLLFASEERALVASGMVSGDISHEAFAQYLAYYSVPHPASIYEGVRALPPGSILRVTAEGTQSIGHWYRLPKYEPIKIGYPEAVSEVRRLLEVSVNYRLVSDVPVGAFLSGGLDSNAIVGLMSRQVSNPIETFTIGFESSSTQSETKWGQIGAESFGARHHERIITGGDVARSLPRFFAAMDSPTGDGLNSFLVSTFAKEVSPELRVVLSGVGGDELFLGYRKYRWLAKHGMTLRAAHLLPTGLRSWIAERLLSASTHRRLIALATVLDPFNIRRLFNADEVSNLTGIPRPTAAQDPHEEDALLQLLRGDIEGYLPDMLLRDLDQFTMSVGLEARAPLLDVPLMEFAWQLPMGLKSQGGSKQLLADAVADVLPKALKDKPKTGFELPMKEWLITGELSRYLAILQSDEMLLVRDGFLKSSSVRAVHRDFVQGRSHYLKPWSIIAMEWWYRAQMGIGGPE